MKKFGKFVFTTVSIAAAIGGAVYFVKNVLNKDNDDDFDDFDDFDDDFDDFDLDTEEDPSAKKEREYVTLNMNEENDAEDSTETAVSGEETEESAEETEESDEE